MEEKDERLIKELVGQDEELKRYFDQHIEFEKRIERYNKKQFLTPEEEIERKKIKKLKLAGRDKIEKILSKYRQ